MIADTPKQAPELEPDDTTESVLAFEEYEQSDQFDLDACEWAENHPHADGDARAAVAVLREKYAGSLAVADKVRQHLEGDTQW